MSNKYTPYFFLEFFKAIPAEDFITGKVVEPMAQEPTRRCALGHTGKPIKRLVRYHAVRNQHEVWQIDVTPMSTAFQDLFAHYGYDVLTINDRKLAVFPQETPKERIIAALEHIIEMESKPGAIVYVYHDIPEPKQDMTCSVSMHIAEALSMDLQDKLAKAKAQLEAEEELNEAVAAKKVTFEPSLHKGVVHPFWLGTKSMIWPPKKGAKEKVCSSS